MEERSGSKLTLLERHLIQEGWDAALRNSQMAALAALPVVPRLTDEQIKDAFRRGCFLDDTTDPRVWYVDGATLNKSDVVDVARSLFTLPVGDVEPRSQQRTPVQGAKK